MKHPPIAALFAILLFLFSVHSRSEAGQSGGGGNGGHKVSVTISPLSSQLATGQSQQFTATVSGTRYKSITWTVNGIAGGNSTVGTVTSAGLYTAPAAAPASPVQITAAATYQSSASASATVVISSNNPVVVSITPTNTSLQLGGTKQFSASVSGTSNTTVTWEVNGTAGGSASLGTISGSGLYTAPTAMPSTSVVVTAQCVAQPTVSASASVQLIASTISVSITPVSASVTEGKTQPFSAQISGTANTAVNWFVSGVAGGNTTFGTVSSSGVYTAPIVIPTSQVVVTAQSAVSPTNSASAAVTVTPPVPHSVNLSWNPTSSSMAGYNIYRSTQTSGPFTRLNAAVDTATIYTDSNVVSGQTYYYAATSVDANGIESSYSNIAQASIP